MDSLRGDAVIQGHSLRLTSGMVVTRPSIGTLIVARNTLAPASIVISFEASNSPASVVSLHRSNQPRSTRHLVR